MRCRHWAHTPGARRTPQFSASSCETQTRSLRRDLFPSLIHSLNRLHIRIAARARKRWALGANPHYRPGDASILLSRIAWKKRIASGRSRR